MGHAEFDEVMGLKYADILVGFEDGEGEARE
jgi:hypothetical protein